MRSKAFATWDEAELLEVSHDLARGDRRRRALGVSAERMGPERNLGSRFDAQRAMFGHERSAVQPYYHPFTG